MQFLKRLVAYVLAGLFLIAMVRAGLRANLPGGS